MAFLQIVVALNTVDTDIYECPATLSGSVHGLVFTNLTGSNQVITLKHRSQLTGLTLPVSSAAQNVPANSQFTWPKPVNVVAGDRLIASCTNAGAVTAVIAVYLDQAAQPPSALVPRGVWSSVASYAINDIVSFDAASYIAVSASLNSTPPSVNWMFLAERGAPGLDGEVTLTGTQTITNKTLVAQKLGGATSGSTVLTVPAIAGANTATINTLLQSGYIPLSHFVTWANLPDPVTGVVAYYDRYFVTDYPGGGIAEVYSDGTKWKTITTGAFNQLEGTSNTSTSTSQTIIKKILLPAAFLKVGDTITFNIGISKNNTTNAQTLAAYIGTAGTTADTLVSTGAASILGATTTLINIAIMNYVVKSATEIVLVGAAATVSGTVITTATRIVAIPNISNALWLSAAVKNDTSTATTISQDTFSLTINK